MNTSGDGLTKKRIGDFEVTRELGRGGMGIVYEARQISLNRKVALKVLGTSLGMTSKAVVRFRREAEAAAKLHHTNIVPIYATGEHEGTHFYAMELVEGPSLNIVIRQLKNSGLDGSRSADHSEGAKAHEAQATRTEPSDGHSGSPVGESTASLMPAWVAETLCPESSSSGALSQVGASSSTLAPGNDYVDTVATMIADVADGLDYAHNNGVIHRDMKPSNLLLSPDGRLSINDFGLARMLEQPGMTMTGEFVGSPLYMSPEQIAAGRVALDHRTDIYSLGATLYELLTLKPPFPGERRDQIIGQILHKEPIPPRKLNKKIPIDLETICLKAMEKDPDRRYQTGAHLAEDLRRFVNRFAISAKRTGVVGRMTKWVRRHPAVAASLVVAMVAGLAAGSFAYSSHLTQMRLRQVELENAKESALVNAMGGNFDEAERQIERAEVAGASTSWVRVLRGQVALYRGKADDAVRHIEQAVELDPNNTAAFGLLTKAVGESGDEDRYVSLSQQLVEMPAVSFQDYLLKGFAEEQFYPSRGIADLDEAIRMRPNSPVARLIRAMNYHAVAMNTGRLADVDRALDDANAALSYLPESTLALNTHLAINKYRARIQEESRDFDGARESMRYAAADAEKLAAFRDNLDARWGRAHYAELVENYDDARSELCGIGLDLTEDQSYISFRCANAWFNDRKYDRALAAYERASTRIKKISWFVPAFIRIEREHGADHLLNQFIAMQKAGSEGASGLYLILDWTVFRLLGNREYADFVAQDYVPNPGEFQTEWTAIKRYMMRGATVEETVEACKSARGALSYAHFAIAMDMLGDGRRRLAAEHFQKCRDAYYFYHYAYYWSRTFLERLKEDPTWPQWIPSGAEEEQLGATQSSTAIRNDE